MNKRNRIWMAVAALLLTGIYLFPIWSIQLNAPQYPEGLGLEIWVNKVQGEEPQDLQNINTLNHYIGMKSITPESIAELKWMPLIFGFMIVSGLIIALLGNRKWVMAWIGAFLVLAIAGLVDFYMWEYDYGHNLNPDAPIKIPGMSYQPPLLGSKQLLNINATSLPDIGFYIAMASIGIASMSWWKDKYRDDEEKMDSENRNHVPKAA